MNGVKYISVFLIVICSLILLVSGCEYDAAEPFWYQDFENPPTPVITQLDPDKVAPAGVNKIKILGENFSENAENNKVYFDNIPAEVLEASTTSITVRRPNVVTDSSIVKVASYDALVVAQYSPYKIEPVMERYGNFLENIQINALAVDKVENIYVFMNSPRDIIKVTPTGEKTIIATILRQVYDVKIDSEGNLILLMNYRRINKVNVETGEETELIDVRKSVSYGDFDNFGTFYVAGRRSDLIVIDLETNNYSPLGVYSRDEIFCVRVYEGYVYLLVQLANADEQNPEFAIWRHEILDAEGNLSERELVLDLTEGDYAESALNSFTFSANGIIYLATDNVNPIMMYDIENNQQDILYKEILPTSAERIVWGNDKYLYMILGGDEWNIVRIDMGISGAPYYGR